MREGLTQYQKEEIRKCMNDFTYFSETYIKILHPLKGLIPFKLYPFQQRVIDTYQVEPYTILRKFRQGGLTTTSVLWGIWKCMFQFDQEFLVVSKTDREAKTAGKIAKRALEHIPDWLKPPVTKDNDHEIQFGETGGYIAFFTPEAARGRALTYLIVDEAAFITNMDEHWKSLFPALATGGRCIVISTVNGMGNWYEETYHRAVEKKNQFCVIDLHYTEHPDYNNDAWVAKMKDNLGDKAWRQEVLGDFLGSGSSYIPPDVLAELEIHARKSPPIRRLFPEWDSFQLDDEEDLANKNWESGALWIWEEPKKHREYVIGADVAEGIGDGGDYSAFHILDVSTNTQVGEFYSNTIRAHEFAQVLKQVGDYYNVALIICDNTGIGHSVLDSLEHYLHYENLYYDLKKRTEKAGITIQRTNRPIILESIKSALINRSLTLNSYRLVKELRTFWFNPQLKRAEARKGKHDDLILALALLVNTKEAFHRTAPVGSENLSPNKSTFRNDLFEELKGALEDGAPEDWISFTEDNSPKKEEKYIPAMLNGYRRNHDRLLKEFGW